MFFGVFGIMLNYFPRFSFNIRVLPKKRPKPLLCPVEVDPVVTAGILFLSFFQHFICDFIGAFGFFLGVGLNTRSFFWRLLGLEIRAN
jgi:hypothetical protein